ncbi:unnamed protein product [Amaranthus hypochondriacus]
MAKEDSMVVNGGGEFMLFGVRVVVDSMRKSVSLNNLSQYEHRLDSSSSTNDVVPSDAPVTNAGYASADEAVVNRSSTTASASRERKRGVPWTEEEHKLFLLGLQTVGKGDWRGISRNFVKTRTPTQVASHAQKYFIRKSNINRRSRRRSSLFDITTDSVAVNQTDDQRIRKETNGGSQSIPLQQQQQQSPKSENSSVIFSVQPQESIRFSSPSPPIYSYNRQQVVDYKMKMIETAATSSNSSSKSMADFDLNLSLSLISSPDRANSRHSAFQVTQRFSNVGDSIISVA